MQNALVNYHFGIYEEPQNELVRRRVGGGEQEIMDFQNPLEIFHGTLFPMYCTI